MWRILLEWSISIGTKAVCKGYEMEDTSTYRASGDTETPVSSKDIVQLMLWREGWLVTPSCLKQWLFWLNDLRNPVWLQKICTDNVFGRRQKDLDLMLNEQQEKV